MSITLFHKDITTHDKVQAKCKLCASKMAKLWHQKNILKKQLYYIANREYILNKTKEYKKSKPYKHAAHQGKRRSIKLLATPKWLTKDHLELIEMKYKLAAYMTEVTGIPHEVDHIIPLQGKKVCGLHVPWNLRVTTETENRMDSNKIKGEIL
jgi:hypothetical protein